MNNRAKQIIKTHPIVFRISGETLCEMLGWDSNQVVFLPLETTLSFEEIFVMTTVESFSRESYLIFFEQEDSDLAVLFKLKHNCELVHAPIGV